MKVNLANVFRKKLAMGIKRLKNVFDSRNTLLRMYVKEIMEKVFVT